MTNKYGKLMEAIKKNHKILDECKLHSFVELKNYEMSTSGLVYIQKPIGKRYKCLICGGQIDAINKCWYNLGLKHGRENK